MYFSYLKEMESYVYIVETVIELADGPCYLWQGFSP